MNSGRSNNLSLKYQNFTQSSCRDIGFRKSEFVTKTQFLWKMVPYGGGGENGRGDINVHDECQLRVKFGDG